MKLGEGTQKVLKKWEKYKYVMLVALVGLLLLLWPASPSEGLGTVSAAPRRGMPPLFWWRRWKGVWSGHCPKLRERER